MRARAFLPSVFEHLPYLFRLLNTSRSWASLFVMVYILILVLCIAC